MSYDQGFIDKCASKANLVERLIGLSPKNFPRLGQEAMRSITKKVPIYLTGGKGNKLFGVPNEGLVQPNRVDHIKHTIRELLNRSTDGMSQKMPGSVLDMASYRKSLRNPDYW